MTHFLRSCWLLTVRVCNLRCLQMASHPLSTSPSSPSRPRKRRRPRFGDASADSTPDDAQLRHIEAKNDESESNCAHAVNPKLSVVQREVRRNTRSFPASTACGTVHSYRRLNYIDEGTFGRVYRAQHVQSGVIYALKKMKHVHSREGFPLSSLREIRTHLSLKHPNIVRLHEIVTGGVPANSQLSIYLVLEYAPHDLQSILSRMPVAYAPSEIKCLMQQLLKGVEHLHSNYIIHRDLKPANLLVSSQGILKIADFGLARMYGDPAVGTYTPTVATLWYRAPELLMGETQYTAAVDIWAVGCIFAELVTKKCLFEGAGELDQIDKIAQLLGRPCEEVWHGFEKLPHAKRIAFRGPKECKLKEKVLQEARTRISAQGLKLLSDMLIYDPARRICAEHALRHEYFREMPAPKDPALIQTFPDDRRG